MKDEYEHRPRCAPRSTPRSAASTRSSPSCRASPPRCAASASSRASSPTRARPTATTSATTRSPRPARTRRILHWTRNDGPVVPGDLVLLDAGVELDSYYTADITRTLPRQRHVLRRAAPGLRGGARGRGRRVRDREARASVFREVHAAAMKVIAREDRRVGLPAGVAPRSRSSPRTSTTAATWCTARATTSASTCTTARRRAASMYLDGVLEAGMVFTIEPGPLLPARRPHRARGVPRHRRAHRGRHPRHRRRRREPVGRHPAHGRRGRGVGARRVPLSRAGSPVRAQVTRRRCGARARRDERRPAPRRR